MDPPARRGRALDNAVTGASAASFTTQQERRPVLPADQQPDPLRDGQIATFAPCGAVAGVIARTDATRGVWKAPAGLDATLGRRRRAQRSR